MLPPSVPPSVRGIRHPLPSTGSLWVGSPASAVLRNAPTPHHPSHRAWFDFTWAVPTLHSAVRSHPPRVLRRRAWSFVTRLLTREVKDGGVWGLPGSWRTFGYVLCSSTPAGLASGHYDTPGVVFPAVYASRAGLPQTVARQELADLGYERICPDRGSLLVPGEVIPESYYPTDQKELDGRIHVVHAGKAGYRKEGKMLAPAEAVVYRYQAPSPLP